MEGIISNLLNRFERGLLTRRELVRSLTMLTAAGSATPVAQAQDASVKGVKIDHVSIQVSDLPASIAFYQKIFGFTILSEDKPNEIVRLGASKVLVSLHHKSPTALVDHFAIGVEKFDRGGGDSGTERPRGKPRKQLGCGFSYQRPGRHQRPNRWWLRELGMSADVRPFGPCNGHASRCVRVPASRPGARPDGIPRPGEQEENHRLGPPRPHPGCTKKIGFLYVLLGVSPLVRCSSGRARVRRPGASRIGPRKCASSEGWDEQWVKVPPG